VSVKFYAESLVVLIEIIIQYPSSISLFSLATNLKFDHRCRNKTFLIITTIIIIIKRSVFTRTYVTVKELGKK
jgi:hypothetical protein